MSILYADYAKMEVNIVLEEKARTMRRLEALDRVIGDYYAQLTITGPHPLEREYHLLQDRMRDLDELIARIPLDKLPSSISVPYRGIPIRDPNSKLEFVPLVIDPVYSADYTALVTAKAGVDRELLYPPTSFDLKVDKDGNLEVVDGVANLTASIIAGLSKNINDSIEDQFIFSNSTPPPRPMEENKASIYESLKKLAKKMGIPILVRKQKDAGKGKDMIPSIQYLAPLGFKVLASNSKQPIPRLYYKVENDGGVLITGEKLPCVLNCTLIDGTLLAGGISPRDGGILFGDRIYRENGVEVKKPLRWVNVDDVVGTVPPNLRKPPKPVPPAKSLNVPVQNIAPPPSKGSVENAAKVLRMVDQGLMSRKEAMKALGIDEWPLRPESGIPDETKVTPSRFELIFGKRGKPWTSKEAPWRDVPTVEQYERLQNDYANMQREMIQLKALLTATQDQNEKLTKKLKVAEETVTAIRHETEVELEKIKNAKLLSQNTRRWQIEAVKTSGVTIEGADATIFELEDIGENLKYLVIATVPGGTPSRVQEQWMEDLQRSLDMRFGEGMVQYVIAPQDTSISLLEVLPGVEEDQDDDDLFQF